MSFIEKVYTEPTGLRQTENSQCSPCTACKRACPDINQENAYWKEIDLPSKRVAYFAYPGLIFGFYLYYFLQSGTWDYYFGGAWTDEPGVVLHAFAPGFNADTAGFFFLPLVPRAVAALVTLLGCAATSWLIFSRGVVRLVDGWISRRQLAVDRRNVVLTITAFTAFVTFYSFAGQPTLRKVDSLPTLAAIVTICVATLSLVRRFGRTQTAFAEQAVARNLLKLPEMKYADLLQAYRESVQESLAEGLVTRAEVQRLTALRDRLKIRTADHERIMRELALTESSLTSSALAAFPEKRLQLAAYADLQGQARGVVTKLLQSQMPPGRDQLDAIVAFETSLYTAQVQDNAAGDLESRSALGGPFNLFEQPFFIGINDLAEKPDRAPFNPHAFTLFSAWATAPDISAGGRWTVRGCSKKCGAR